MKATLSFSLLKFIMNALIFCVSFVLYHFTPVKEKAKGIMTYVDGKVSPVVHNCKGWMYAEFSRLREYTACPLAYS